METWNESYLNPCVNEVHRYLPKSNIFDDCLPDSGGDPGRIYMERPEDMLDPSQINPAFLPIIITHAITFIIGIAGNIVVILTWAGRVTWDVGGSVCKLSSYVEMLCGISSVLNLVAVSIERFLVIVYPIKARRLCTLSTSRRGLLLVWSLAVILALPVVFTKRIYPITYYNNHTSETAYYCWDSDDGWATFIAIYQLLAMFAIPGVLMVICYFCVIQELWVSTRTMASMTKNLSTSLTGPSSSTTNSNSNNTSTTTIATSAMGNTTVITTPINTNPSSVGSNSFRSDYQIRWPSNKHEKIVYPKSHSHGFHIRQARKQVIKMLIFVVLIFLFCWGPRLIINVVIKFGLQDYNQTIYSARVTCYLLSFIHSALNPFIYGFMSTNFRKMMCSSCSHTGHGQTSQSVNYVNNNTGSCSLASDHHHHHIIGCVRESIESGIGLNLTANETKSINLLNHHHLQPNLPHYGSILTSDIILDGNNNSPGLKDQLDLTNTSYTPINIHLNSMVKNKLDSISMETEIL
ncbi:cholecystokinin receptor type A-like isoform X2 [Panonychus citri]|uniref:cholecystokinin receptor type A-like isoform X2 n=1 Tax=Panonychus citri TaxID=50023 RepID=UPI0023070874|nr:cholecystokinin receptor type A-like isoform X2 [Panonychus citri]